MGTLTFRQQLVSLLLIVALVIFLLSVETYQFYYLISKVFETKIVYDNEVKL